MRINPLDIRQQSFTARMFKGFDPEEVDAFLEDVAESLESALKENALLKDQLLAMEERTRGLAEREKLLQDTLTTTQRLAEDMKEASKREAALHRPRRGTPAGEDPGGRARRRGAHPQQRADAQADATTAGGRTARDPRDLPAVDRGLCGRVGRYFRPVTGEQSCVCAFSRGPRATRWWVGRREDCACG